MLVNAGKTIVANLLGNLSSQAAPIYFAYGTGTTAPTENDTTLVSEVARKAALVYYESVLDPNDTIYIFAVFDIDTATTVREIACFDAGTGGNMLFRELKTVSCSANSELQLGMRITSKITT